MTNKILTSRQLVARNASERADARFLEFYDDVVTYGELAERANAVADYLVSRGVTKGDVVAFMMGNTPAFFYVLLGVQQIGAIAGPVSCWWQSAELEYLVGDAKPPILIIDAEFAPLVSAVKEKIAPVRTIVVNSESPMELDFPHDYLPEILREHAGASEQESRPSPDDVASVMYTSGTTGVPKGVLLTHRGILEGARLKTGVAPISPGDRSLCVLPLFHSGGLNDLAYPCMYGGLTIVLRRQFSASEFWQCVERYRVNGFYIVPTMWNILLRAPEAAAVDTSSLRFGLSGAAPIPADQLEECERRFGIPILEAYGSTENSGGITANTFDARKRGSIGVALPELDVRVFDERGCESEPGTIGEIVVRGETLMQGYHNAPEATAEAIRKGWLYTGDMGYVDEDGFFFIVDRKKDLIIRGGVNVYPKEIETVIAGHPLVEAVAVIPEPHEKYGQVAKACVVLKRGQALAEEPLRRFCLERMAQYKVPESFVFRARLPKNAIGKVVKKDLLRDLAEEAHAEPVPVAHLFDGMPGRFLPDRAEGVDATISYRITGGGGGDWSVRIRDGRMTVSGGILENPRVYVVARDSDYHDIATGKIDGVTAVISGKLTIEGDVNFMAELSQMMRPYKAK